MMLSLYKIASYPLVWLLSCEVEFTFVPMASFFMEFEVEHLVYSILIFSSTTHRQLLLSLHPS
jgi:hypothetical protein